MILWIHSEHSLKTVFMFQYMESCYWIRNNVNLSWEIAEETCREDGGHLWSINSHEEWSEVILINIKNIAYTLYPYPINFVRNWQYDPLTSKHFFVGFKDGKVIATLCKLYCNTRHYLIFSTATYTLCVLFYIL